MIMDQHFKQTEAYKNRKKKNELPEDHNKIAYKNYSPRCWGNPDKFPTLVNISQYMDDMEDLKRNQLGYKVSKFVHSFNRMVNKFSRPWTHLQLMIPHQENQQLLMPVLIDLLDHVTEEGKENEEIYTLMYSYIQARSPLNLLEYTLHAQKNYRINVLEEMDLPYEVIADLKGYARMKVSSLISHLHRVYETLKTAAEEYERKMEKERLTIINQISQPQQEQKPKLEIVSR